MLYRHYDRRLGVQVLSEEKFSYNPKVITIAIFNPQCATTKIIVSDYYEDYLNRALYYCSALCAFIFSKKFLNHEKIGKGDKKIDTDLRRDIKVAYKYTCQICGDPILKKKTSIHHVCASYLGGQSVKENLVLFCSKHHERLHELIQCTELWMNDNFSRYILNFDLLDDALKVVKYYVKDFFNNKEKYRKIFADDLYIIHN